jgi:hypothetical protein
MYSNMDVAEAEQWRCAFWFGPMLICRFDYWLMFCIVLFSHRLLVVLDRLMSASFSQLCAIQEEEYVKVV